MGKSKGIKAGQAFIKFGVDDSGVGRSLDRIKARLNDAVANVGKLGAGIAGLGLAVTAGLGVAFKQFTSVGDALDKMSARTGFTAESLSALGFAAEQSGTSLATLESGIKGMQKRIEDLGRGVATNVDAFGKLGLSYKDLESLDPESQFKLIADRLAAIENPGKRAATAMETFGRAGQQLLPLLNGGAKGIEAFKAEAEDLGIVIGTDITNSAAQAADAINRIKKQIVAISVTIGSALAGPITKVASIISELLPDLRKFAEDNAGLVQAIGGVAVGAVALGTALAGIAGVVLILPPLVGALATGLGALASLALPAVGLAATAAALSMLPIGGILKSTGEAVSLFAGNVKGLVAPLGEVFVELGQDIKRTFGDIRDALAGGDISGAGKILFAALRVEFETGQLALITTWEGFKNDFLSIGADAFLGVAKIAVGATAFIAKSFNDLNASLANIFTEIGGQIEEAFGLVKFGSTVAANTARGAFDEDFDADAANNAASENLRATVKGNVAGEREAAQIIESNRRAAEASIDATASRITESLTEGVTLFKGNVEQAQAQAIDAAKADLASAMDALASARRQTAEVEQGGGNGLLGGFIDTLKTAQAEAINQLQGGRDAAAVTGAAVQSRGSFDARNIRSFGDDAATRTARASEETAKNTKAIANKPRSRFT